MSGEIESYGKFSGQNPHWEALVGEVENLIDELNCGAVYEGYTGSMDVSGRITFLSGKSSYSGLVEIDYAGNAEKITLGGYQKIRCGDSLEVYETTSLVSPNEELHFAARYVVPLEEEVDLVQAQDIMLVKPLSSELWIAELRGISSRKVEQKKPRKNWFWRMMEGE